MLSIEKLRRFPLFSGLDHETLKSLAITGEEMAVEADTWLFLEGEQAEALYLIMGGTIDLKMSTSAERDQQADLERLTEYEVFGWSALVKPHVYTLSAYVAADTDLMVISAETLMTLMAENAEVGYKLMTRMAETIRRRLSNMHTRFVSLTEVT